MEPAVTAEGLTKTYRVYARPLQRLWEAVDGRVRHRTFPALADVSFALPPGEGLGIIGENGAGKSTLLKILAGITRPSAGSYRVAGKIAAILELGAGFHPEFSGRQNAVLNAALLGLAQDEVAAALPRILEFAELGDFIDQPVKTYSTGMAMRLAFSIATQVEPAVLIIDEALSVGDGYFQKKCLDRLQAFIAGGGTVLFCSHAMYYVTALCRHALWLREGRMESCGPALEVVHAYEEHLAARQASAAVTSEVAPDRRPGPGRLVAVRWADGGRVGDGGPRSFAHAAPWGLEVEWESDRPERAFQLAVGVDRNDHVQVCAFATHHDGLPPFRGGERYRATLRVPALPIVKGELALYVFLLDENGLHVYDQAVIPAAFRVEGERYRTGMVTVEHDWHGGPLAVVAAAAMPAAASATVGSAPGA